MWPPFLEDTEILVVNSPGVTDGRGPSFLEDKLVLEAQVEFLESGGEWWTFPRRVAGKGEEEAEQVPPGPEGAGDATDVGIAVARVYGAIAGMFEDPIKDTGECGRQIEDIAEDVLLTRNVWIFPGA